MNLRLAKLVINVSNSDRQMLTANWCQTCLLKRSSIPSYGGTLWQQCTTTYKNSTSFIVLFTCMGNATVLPLLPKFHGMRFFCPLLKQKLDYLFIITESKLPKFEFWRTFSLVVAIVIKQKKLQRLVKKCAKIQT